MINKVDTLPTHQGHLPRRNHWALLPFLLGVVIGLAISTVALLRPHSETVTTNVYINIGQEDLRHKIDFKGKFTEFDHLLEELHAQNRGTRRLSEEVVMKDTVYYAIIVPDRQSTDSLSVIRKTWAKDIKSTSIDFFVAGEESKKEDVNDGYVETPSSGQLEFETLKHICNKRLNTTKWFFLSYDNIYIKTAQFEHFLLSVEDSQSDLGYLGKPIRRDPVGRVCMPGPGSVLSHSILTELCPKLSECDKLQGNAETDCVLGECVRKQLPSVQCAKDGKLHELFLKFDEAKRGAIVDPKNQDSLDKSVTVYPIMDPSQMYSIHQVVLSRMLNDSQEVIQGLKRSVDQMTEMLPQTDISVYNDRADSELALGEDDVTPWNLVNSNMLMSCVESSPATKLKSLWKKELEVLSAKSIEHVNSQEEDNYSFKRMINAYWRVNPLVGTEYVVDFEAKLAGSESDFSSPSKHFTVSLVRQYSEPAVNPVVHQVDSTRHVSIGVFVTDDLMGKFKHFMIRFERTLKLDQRFDLITVHMKGTGKSGASKELSGVIQKYENKYPKASFKVIKSPHALSRAHGISLLVQELRPNDLVFIADVDLEFDVKFMDRCRNFPLQGQQVYFPIPFNRMDPGMISAMNHSNLEESITQHSGYWLVDSYSISCVYTVDILSAIQQEDYKGLPAEVNIEEMYAKFVKKGYSILRGTDSELVRMYSNDRECVLDLYGETHEHCKSLPETFEKLYLKTQLSTLLLDHEGEHAHKKY